MATAKKTAKRRTAKKPAKRKTAKRKTIARGACAKKLIVARKAARRRCARKVRRAVGKTAVHARKRDAQGHFLNPAKKAAGKGRKKGGVAMRRSASGALAGRVTRLEHKVASHDHALRSHGLMARSATTKTAGKSRKFIGPTMTPAFKAELARRQEEALASKYSNPRHHYFH